MKKLAICLVIVLMLSLVGCTSTGFVEADNLVRSWNQAEIAGCTYACEFDKADNMYYVVAKATDEYYTGRDSRLWDAVTVIIAEQIQEKLYPQLESALNGSNVDIGIGIYDYTGELYCVIYNGEIQY